MSSVFVDDEAADVALLRSKANPFQDVPLDKKATEVKDGLLQRKLHADVDGKRSECSTSEGSSCWNASWEGTSCYCKLRISDVWLCHGV